MFFFLLAAVFLTTSGTAYARSGYLGTFNTTYGTSGTKLDDCITCHGGSTSTFNPYGQAVRSLFLGGSTILAALTTVEPQDSDGDGYTNRAEITARTFPGNAADFPAPTNTAPAAANDTYSVNAGATLNVPAPGVLSNDTDAQNNTLTAVLVSGPASGTLNLNANGSFTYAAPATVPTGGSVSFTYRANDGSLNSNTATVTITVNSTNTAPVAANDTYSVNAGATLNVPAPGVLSNDTDAQNNQLTAVLVSGPASGTLTLNANGSFTYVAPATVPTGGSASFTYRASDGSLNSNTATVTITVNSTAPPAAGELNVTPANGEVDVPVNTVVSATGSGTDIRTIFDNNTFTLTPAPGTDGSRETETSSGLVCVSDGIVRGTFAYNESLTTATFTPNCPLKEGTVYVGTIMANGIAVQTAPRTWQFTTIAESPDTDHDGVPDNEDDFPRNRGKATPPNPKGHGKYLVEVDADSGIYLSAMTAVSDTSARLNQAGRLAGYEFKDGVISYRIEGVPVGATVTLDIVSPSGVPKGSKVYKVDETGFHEYSSAVINGNTVTLTLTDGGSGDSDGLANGVIVDPVGIASPAASGSGSIDLSTNAAGGGCSISGTDDRNAAVSLGMLILLGAALIGARAVAKRAARR